MAVRKFKPTTPGQRHKIIGTFEEITASVPEKSLVYGKRSTGGRNHVGKMTMRYIGGGHKRKFRIIDFKRNKDGVPAVVKTIEYDPNRSARIARVKDQYNLYHYILADTSMVKGKTIRTGEEAPIEASNRLPLSVIPVGTMIYAIELTAGKGAQMVRAAGAKAQLMAKEGNYATIKLPSGEVRKVRLEATAAIGVVGNVQHQNVKIGSAGRKRRKGIRPTVRGVVMNAADHPHGGGDGGRHGTGKAPRTPWGQLTLGYRTRRRKGSNKLIVRTRHDAKRKR